MKDLQKQLKKFKWMLFIFWVTSFFFGMYLFAIGGEAWKVVEAQPINVFAMAFWGFPIIWFVYPITITKLSELQNKNKGE